MMSCAFTDCGRPDCHLCALARVPLRRTSTRVDAGAKTTKKATPPKRLLETP